VVFAHFARCKDLVRCSRRSGPGDARGRAIPHGFQPVTDALLTDGDVRAAATETGRALAADGVPLDDVFADLEATYAAVGMGQPDYEVVVAVCLAWTETSLRYLHGLSCDDPLTGLASLPHLHSRLDEVYREAERCGTRMSTERALVVVEAYREAARNQDGPVAERSVDHSIAQHFGSALQMAEIAGALRTVFSGGETLARAGVHRVVVLVRRHPDLAAQVESLRQLLESRSAAKPAGGSNVSGSRGFRAPTTPPQCSSTSWRADPALEAMCAAHAVGLAGRMLDG
jgi:hypothetical protein